MRSRRGPPPTTPPRRSSASSPPPRIIEAGAAAAEQEAEGDTAEANAVEVEGDKSEDAAGADTELSLGGANFRRAKRAENF